MSMMRAKYIIIFRIRLLKVADNFTITSRAIFILAENVPLLYRMYFENSHNIVLRVLAGCMHLFNTTTYIVAHSCLRNKSMRFCHDKVTYFAACLYRAIFTEHF